MSDIRIQLELSSAHKYLTTALVRKSYDQIIQFLNSTDKQDPSSEVYNSFFNNLPITSTMPVCYFLPHHDCHIASVLRTLPSSGLAHKIGLSSRDLHSVERLASFIKYLNPETKDLWNNAFFFP